MDDASGKAHNEGRKDGDLAFCPECGSPQGTGQKFCATCGTQLGGVITTTAPAGPFVPARAPVTAMSIIAFILGLFSLIGVPIPIYYFFSAGRMIVGALAIIGGMLAHGSARQKGLEGDALATAGIVLGVIGTVMGVVFVVTTGVPF